MTLSKLEALVSKVWVLVPLKFTVPLLWVKVPPVCDQLPETFIVPDGAVSVPEDKVTAPVVTVPDEPVKVPPETVRPPVKVCKALDA